MMADGNRSKLLCNTTARIYRMDDQRIHFLLVHRDARISMPAKWATPSYRCDTFGTALGSVETVIEWPSMLAGWCGTISLRGHGR